MAEEKASSSSSSSSQQQSCARCCSGDGGVAGAAENVDVVVVGAGVSGLAAARKLSESGLRTVVLEAQDKPGGRLCLRDVEGFGRLHFGAQFIHGEDTHAHKWHTNQGWDLVSEDFPRLLYTKETGVIDVTEPVEDDDVAAALDALDALSADGDHGTSSSSSITDHQVEEGGGDGTAERGACGALLAHHFEEMGLSPRAQRIAEALLCSDRNCDLSIAATNDCSIAEREWPHGVSDCWMPSDLRYRRSLTQYLDIRCGHVVTGIKDWETTASDSSDSSSSSSSHNHNSKSSSGGDGRAVVVSAQLSAGARATTSANAPQSMGGHEQALTTQGSQHTFHAQHVLVTCSVAVLQRGAIAFHPPLPPWKTAAIQSVDAPPALKVFLRFSNAFWGDMRAVVCADGPAPEMWAHEDGVPVMTCFLPARWRREAIDTDAEREQLQPPPLFDVECWAGLHTWQRATLLRLLSQLRQVFPQAEPECLRALFVDWADVPYVWCGYTAPTGSLDARRRLQQRCGRVHFAGEATSPILDVSMQGAMGTGEARAEDIIAAMRTNTKRQKCGEP